MYIDNCMRLQLICASLTSMAAEPTADTIAAWTRLMRTQQAMLARVEEALKRAGHPALEWYDVLYELDMAERGWLRQADVNARVLLAQYNLSRLVDRMAREGLLERRQCPVDGRNNVLSITPKGRELRARMWPVYAGAIEAHMGAHLAEGEARSLAELLAKLLAAQRSAPPA